MFMNLNEEDSPLRQRRIETTPNKSNVNAINANGRS